MCVMVLGGIGEGGDGFSRAYVNFSPSSRRRQIRLHHMEKLSPASPLPSNVLQIMRKFVVIAAARGSPKGHHSHQIGGWRHWRRFDDTWKGSIATAFALVHRDLMRFGEGSDGYRAYGAANHSAAEADKVFHRIVRETIASIARSIYVIKIAAEIIGDTLDVRCRQLSPVSPHPRLDFSNVQQLVRAA